MIDALEFWLEAHRLVVLLALVGPLVLAVWVCVLAAWRTFPK